jgi:MFS transporter, PAT family, solute carrier family 33 (acetyl-CoA transportor), member 1
MHGLIVRRGMLGIPVLTLSAYLQFWSVICYCVTIWLIFFKKEVSFLSSLLFMILIFSQDPVSSDDPDLNVKKVYQIMWRILRLRRLCMHNSSLTWSEMVLYKDVWILCTIHFTSKIGTIANDSITSLKLIEKGLRKEQLSIIVTIDFVVQLFGGYYAARWAKGDRPLRPWIYAYWVRLGLAVTSMGVIYIFPKPPVSTAFLVLVAVNYISTQFASYGSFTSICLHLCSRPAQGQYSSSDRLPFTPEFRIR